MSSPPAIRVENLGKRYKLGLTHAGSLRELAARLTDRLLRRHHGPLTTDHGPRTTDNGQLTTDHGPRTTDHGPPPPAPSSHVWALRNVSFDVQPGEVVGIIGRNGAGKSTLLKILSRITAPTEGRVEIRGRVASLLEVGTGFHPELTGRENVFLNGAILGMTKAEIRRKFDEIVDFSGIERFIDTPVKRYSSGMYVRLAFAVAAHLEPEILLVDEVLAVGDAAFQQKCLGKLGQVASTGRTVLFVSHQMHQVVRLTHRAVLFDGGEASVIGETREVVDRYLSYDDALDAVWLSSSENSKSPADIRAVRITDSNGSAVARAHADHEIYIEIDYSVSRAVDIQIAFRLNSMRDGSTVFTSAPTDRFHHRCARVLPGRYRARCRIPPCFICPGRYCLLVAANDSTGRSLQLLEQVLCFEITAIGSLAAMDHRLGSVTPVLDWNISDLP